MTTSKNLTAYIAFKNLAPMQIVSIIKAVKAEKGKVKGVAKLDRLCFEYFVNNVYEK